MRRSVGRRALALTLSLAASAGCRHAFVRVSPSRALIGRHRDALRSREVPAGDIRLASAAGACREGQHAERAGQRRRAIGLYRDAAAWAAAVLGDPVACHPPGDPRHEWVHQAGELHNRALGRMLRLVAPGPIHPRRDWVAELAESGVDVRATTRELDPRRLDSVRPTDDYAVAGPVQRPRFEGLGVPVVASRRLADERQGAEAFYPKTVHRAATAVIRPGAGARTTLVLHDPVVERCAGGRRLSHDLSPPLVAQLAGTGLPLYEYYGVIRPGHLHEKAGVYLVDAYRPGTVPVLLIQGMCSGPEVWASLIAALRADPALRGRCQFWVVLYPTTYPLPETAAMVRRSLAEVRRTLDPSGEDPALDRMVVVGKSTGGNLARMLAQEIRSALWDSVFARPIEAVAASDALRARLAEQFFYRPVPSIRRVVFVATPHRGSRLANQATGRPSSLILRYGDPSRRDHDALIVANGRGIFQPTYQHRPLNTIDNLEVNSPLLLAVDAAPFASGVAYHSIIGDRGRPASRPVERVGDGLVGQASAHLDGAASECVLPVGHFCESEPGVIAEVGRILHEHLAEIDGDPTRPD
jgi:hypothetical protein